MPCCICASGSAASTTSLGKGGREHEKKVDLDRPGGVPRNHPIHLPWRRAREVSLELAPAGVVWMAADYLLAGARTAASLPDSVRRPWRSRLSSFQYALEDATADGRTLGADDARRTRKSQRAVVSLRIRAARGQADAVSPGLAPHGECQEDERQWNPRAS